MVTAIAEYARRFSVEILSDAMDYAPHAGRSEIDAADIRLALSLLDSR